jgi:hypothetical protein
MYQRIMFCLCISIGLTVNAQTVNLRGIVSNQAGKPISNAIVALLRQGLKDTTGSDGAYSITGNIAAVLPVLVPQTEKISLNRGALELYLTNPSPVKVEIFDVTGNLLKKELLQNAAAGVYRLNIAKNSLATKLLVIKASIGKHVLTFRHMPLNSSYMVNPSGEYSTPVGGGLAKMAADIDTLKTTASGYTTKVMTINSYDQQMNITLDTSGSAIPSIGCGKTPTLKNGIIKITSSGTNREYTVDIPADYDKNHPYRLVFGYHWIGATMQNVVTGNTVQPAGTWKYFGLLRLDTTKRTTIFVAPQGIDNGWANTDGRDLIYTDDMIKQISDDLCIDKSRIFAVGFSYGSAMCVALACDRADVFRAIAAQNGGNMSGCKDGTKPIAFYAAGGTDSYSTMSNLAAKFAKNNGCAAMSTPQQAAGSKLHTCYIYKDCNPGYPVEFCTFDAGHKSTPYDGGCPDCDDGLKSWEPPEIWAFFTQF